MCAKFGSDRFRNVNLYKFHTNKQTSIFIYKMCGALWVHSRFMATKYTPICYTRSDAILIHLTLVRSGQNTGLRLFVFSDTAHQQGCTGFPNDWESPHRRQKGDIKHGSYWGPTNIGCYRTKLSCWPTRCPGFVHPCINVGITNRMLSTLFQPTSYHHTISYDLIKNHAIILHHIILNGLLHVLLTFWHRSFPFKFQYTLYVKCE